MRQSIIRLLDRRKEIISGIRSYLEMAQESLEQFSKDEAALFELPKDENKFSEELNEKAKRRQKNLSSDKDGELDEEAQPLPPGAEDMDDIIDELD